MNDLRELARKANQHGAKLQIRECDHERGPILLVGHDTFKRRVRVRGDVDFVYLELQFTMPDEVWFISPH